jgi:UDP-GlcNAc:undecaprenyl-phosphate GlcNAc-1-phosphate transferase
MDLLLAFVLAMSVTMALIPLLARVAGRLRVLDQPNSRKVHVDPVPRIGGVAMFAGALVPLLFMLRDDPRLPAYLVAALVLLAMGVWDDRSELSYVPKFAAQFAAAVIAMTWGSTMIHSVTMGGRIELPLLVAMPLTLVFLVGVTNAINLADGLDGLAGGTTLLSCCAMAVLALAIDDRFVAAIAVIVAGCILGFLRFNTYPARIFMGDGGSQFLGFTVAVIAVLLTQSGSSPYSAALPVMLLGLPILDTLFVIVQRIREGRSPFTADKNHLHHRLLGFGFQHFEAVFIIYLLQAVLFLMAWALRYESDPLIIGAFAVFAGVVLGVLHAGEADRWQWRPAAAPGKNGAAIASGPTWWQRLRSWLPRWTLAAGGALVAAYAVRTAWTAGPISTDIGWLATGLTASLIAAGVLSIMKHVSIWVPQMALYVSVVVVVFLDVTSTARLPGLVEKAGLALLLVCIMISFRLTLVRRFQLTTLDFLVVFIALALPNLAGSIGTPHDLSLGVVKLLLLFYAVELLLSHSTRSRVLLQVAGVGVLAGIALRALI